MYDTFPDLKMKQEFSFGQGDWVCAVYTMEGTHGGTLKGPGGQEIPATNRPVRMSICSALRLERGEIVEEHLYFDRLSMMAQLGLAP